MFDDVKESYKENDESLHFFYNREERIAKAPQIVQDYYNGHLKPVKGIRVLFTRQNRYIFLSLLFFVAALWIYTGFNKSRNYAKINEIDCEIQAFSFEEQIFVSISCKRNVKSKSESIEKIDAEIFLVDADNQVSKKEVLSAVYSKDEIFLRSKYSDYEIIRVDAMVSVGNETKEISTKVQR